MHLVDTQSFRCLPCRGLPIPSQHDALLYTRLLHLGNGLRGAGFDRVRDDDAPEEAAVNCLVNHGSAAFQFFTFDAVLMHEPDVAEKHFLSVHLYVNSVSGNFLRVADAAHVRRAAVRGTN